MIEGQSIVDIVGAGTLVKYAVFAICALTFGGYVWYLRSPFAIDRPSISLGDIEALPTPDLFAQQVGDISDSLCSALATCASDGEQVRRTLLPLAEHDLVEPMCATIASLVEDAYGELYIDRVRAVRSAPDRFKREAGAEPRVAHGVDIPDREYVTDTTYVACPPGEPKQVLRTETWRWRESFPPCPTCGGVSEDGACQYCHTPVAGERTWRVCDVWERME